LKRLGAYTGSVAACSLSLSDISGWRDGVLYPWRVVAEEPGAAHFGFSGAMLLDLLGPALRLLTDVADFHFSDIPVRGDVGARAIGANDDAAAVELRGRRRQRP
jgi:hypothetical protein